MATVITSFISGLYSHPFGPLTILGSLLAIPALAIWLRNAFYWRKAERRPVSDSVSESPNAAAANEELQVAPVERALRKFFLSEIEFVHFGHMWSGGSLSDEPYLLFGIHVRNYTPHSVELISISGRAQVNNIRCTQEARLPMKALVHQIEDGPYSLAIEQPISKPLAGTLERMLGSDEVIPFNLFGLEWVGEIVLESGNRALPSAIRCPDSFEVVGPVTHAHSQAYLLPTRLAGRA